MRWDINIAETCGVFVVISDLSLWRLTEEMEMRYGAPMQFSQEFFMQRSFEVVWAVFRVGKFVARKDLRELLEKRALTYLSEKTLAHVYELEEVIKLAMQIGEIRDVNGSVLLRETGNLREAIIQQSQQEELQKGLGESVEEIFGENIYEHEIFQEGIQDGQDSYIGEDISSHQVESGKELPESGKENDNLAKESRKDEEVHSWQMQERGNTSIHDDGTRESGNMLPHLDMTSYERKQVILGLLQSRNMCGMKEIIAALPEVSERTLRYDVKGLVDRKLIERVGRGGPDSFLRLSTRG